MEPYRAQEVRAWSTWILHHADRVDPRLSREGMPTAPKSERDDLRPYLPAGHCY
ncbi:hypothetical protein [Plantactinospora sp. KBS50]|uniref:hypothetical protein n=1 Tax=Plantactinospora sp. KBS50 TaxID=2024580 RepID=UPI0012FDC779|nr:hypothetical protein [Plantactinospora sp. KBS50]